MLDAAALEARGAFLEHRGVRRPGVDASLNQAAKRERPLFDSIAQAKEWLATQV